MFYYGLNFLCRKSSGNGYGLDVHSNGRESSCGFCLFILYAFCSSFCSSFRSSFCQAVLFCAFKHRQGIAVFFQSHVVFHALLP